ncbi:hypothetical protein [Bacillus sp. 2205SS5-2]|uniref:hypothetical protein n=1 Tax=Bacillus sp. 2205SS5-2 TaxID=3109031 RepID=UPI0030050F33
MKFKFNFWKNLRQPSTSFYQLGMVEAIKWPWAKMFLLILFSGLIFTVNASFGIGTNILAPHIVTNTLGELTAQHVYFLLGSLLAGIFFSLFYLFLPTIFFWSISEESFHKLFIVGMISFLPLLIERVMYLVLVFTLNVEWYYSPFSLGVIAEEITNLKAIIYFAGAISLFKGWAIYLQFRGLSLLTERRPALLLFYICFIHLLFWGASTLLEYIDFTSIL